MRRLVAIGLSLLFLSCTGFQNENGMVAYRWEEESLIIENGFSESVYYAVFDQDVLAVIDWVPVSTEENRLLPDDIRVINQEEIFGYEEGNNIVLFYWRNDEPPYEGFENVIIETD